MRNKLLFIFFIFIPSFFYGSQILSLRDSIYMALNNNTDIKNAFKSYEQNKLDQLKTLSMYIPNIGLNYTTSSINEPNVSQTFSSYPIDNNSFNPYISFMLPGGGHIKAEYKSDYSKSNPKIMPGFTASPESYTRKFMISFSQPLLQNLLLIPYDINILRMAKYSKNIAKLAVLQAADNIAYTSAVTYINIFINKLNLKVMESSLKRAELLLKKNKKKKKLGLVENTDILNSSASLKKRYSDLMLTKNQIRELKDNLKLLINTEHFFVISTNIKIKNQTNTLQIDVQKEVETAYKNRIDLKILEQQKYIQKLRILNSKSKLFPQLNLIGSYSYYGNAANEEDSSGALYNGDNKSWTIGINLSYPIYPKSPISELKKVKLELDKLDNSIKKKKLEIANQIRFRVNSIRVNQNRIKLLEERIILQKQKLKEEEQKYKIGRSSTQIILMYQDDIESAETEYLRVKLNYYISLLALEYNKGTFLKSYYRKYYNKINSLK